jgi:hypothetical protein
MANPEPILINIGNVNDGAIGEAFSLALTKVMENIRDVNCPATKTREIVLSLKLRPHADRVEVDTTLTSTVRLASIEPHEGKLFMGADTEGNPYAFADDPRQQVLFSPPKKEEDNIVKFATGTR